MMNDDCIIAKGEVTRLGYIRLWNKGNRILAHRYEYEKVYGQIQDGFEIDHICKNRGCCNVNHLRAVTHTKNMRNAVTNKFVENDIPVIKTLREIGFTYQRIANIYGCTKQSIWLICKGKQWVL